MRNFNKMIPAVVVAIIGFVAGATVFHSLLAEPEQAPVADTERPSPIKKAAKPAADQPILTNDQG